MIFPVDLLTVLNYRWSSYLNIHLWSMKTILQIIFLILWLFPLGVFEQIILNFIFKSCVYTACVLTCVEYACRYMHCADVSKGQRLESFSFISHLIFVEDRVSPVSGAHCLAGLAGQWVSGILLSLLHQHRCFTGGFIGVCYPAQCAYVCGKDLNSTLI